MNDKKMNKKHIVPYLDTFIEIKANLRWNLIGIIVSVIACIIAAVTIIWLSIEIYIFNEIMLGIIIFGVGFSMLMLSLVVLKIISYIEDNQPVMKMKFLSQKKIKKYERKGII